MNIEDRRVKKTKNAMNAALATLLRKKPLKKITVREIAELADINRGTFYLHYRDVYDMVKKIEEEFFDKFNEIFDNYIPGENIKVLSPLLSDMLRLIYENADITKALFGKNGDATFIDHLKTTLKEKCFLKAHLISDIKDDTEFSYFYQYTLSGILGVIRFWLDNDMKESIDEIAKMTESFIIKE